MSGRNIQKNICANQYGKASIQNSKNLNPPSVLIIHKFFHRHSSAEIERAWRQHMRAWQVLIKFAQHICRFSLARSLINMQMQTTSDTDC
jgi:hypothetical protein